MPEVDREELLRYIRSMPPASSAETEDEVAARVATSLAAAGRRRVRKQAEMPKITPRFDPVINWGHILTVITIMGGFALAYSNYTAKIAAIEQSIDQSNIRAATALPKLDAALKTNDVQDERIQNLSIAIQDLRRSQNEMVVLMGQIREDMATVRAKLAIERPNR